MDMDVDDLELQAKIADLAGRINRYKAGGDAYQTPYGHWTPQRGSHHAYGRGRGRGGVTRPVQHRHRTLILNGPGSQSSTSTSPATSDAGTSGWVTRNDRHRQLINTSVYDQKTQERIDAITQTRRQRQVHKGEQEKAMVYSHAQATTNAFAQEQDTIHPPAHHVMVNNIRFYVADGGSKLVKAQGQPSKQGLQRKSSSERRCADDINKLHTTPKRAVVGGVTFLRSKGGNLYRSGLVKNHRDQTGPVKSQRPCLPFSTTGTCPKGPACRYIHDPDRVAMCKDFLKTGECQAGAYCDLSHDPTSERVPACLHFLRGSCTNPNCRYAHVRVNQAAPVCKAFAVYGFCSKGSGCQQRHVHECPDYANKGFCRNDKCHLPHVDRAGKLRKAAAAMIVGDEDDDRSDISSEPAYDSDDIDSDDIDEELLRAEAAGDNDLSEQTDFVRV